MLGRTRLNRSQSREALDSSRRPNFYEFGYDFGSDPVGPHLSLPAVGPAKAGVRACSTSGRPCRPGRRPGIFFGRKKAQKAQKPARLFLTGGYCRPGRRPGAHIFAGDRPFDGFDRLTAGFAQGRQRKQRELPAVLGSRSQPATLSCGSSVKWPATLPAIRHIAPISTSATWPHFVLQFVVPRGWDHLTSRRPAGSAGRSH
jgi:hypothetical protein